MRYIKLFGRDYAIYWWWPFIARLVTPQVILTEIDCSSHVQQSGMTYKVLAELTKNGPTIFIRTPEDLLEVFGQPPSEPTPNLPPFDNPTEPLFIRREDGSVL